MKELLDIIPQIGKIEWLNIRPVKRGLVECVDKINISTQSGINGDHYSKEGGNRMVTLIQQEHLIVVANILGEDKIDPALVRRNIGVSGINLLSLHKRKLQIGRQVILECTGYCHPCSRMEENLGKGGYNAMRGHGGITAKVINGGEIYINDEVKLMA